MNPITATIVISVLSLLLILAVAGMITMYFRLSGKSLMAVAQARTEGDAAGHARALAELSAHFTQQFEKYKLGVVSEIRTQRFLPKGRHPVHFVHAKGAKSYAFVQIVTTEMIPGTTDQPYPEFAVIHLDTKRPVPPGIKALVIDDDPLHFES